MTIDNQRTQEQETQILPQNRILNWLRNLFYLFLSYYLITTYLIPYLEKYELYINYTPLIFMSIISTFIWLYIFNKYNFFIKSFTLDLSNLPLIYEIKGSTKELNSFSYYHQGKPLQIIYNNKPIPHDHLKLSAGFEMSSYYNRTRKILIENIKLNKYNELFIPAIIDLLGDIANETNFSNIEEELINHYEKTTSQADKDNELINQLENDNSDLGLMETNE